MQIKNFAISVFGRSRKFILEVFRPFRKVFKIFQFFKSLQPLESLSPRIFLKVRYSSRGKPKVFLPVLGFEKCVIDTYQNDSYSNKK